MIPKYTTVKMNEEEIFFREIFIVRPSKQKELHAAVFREVRNGFPGMRLPAERCFAARLGVARKTLRFTLARLEEEGAITRNTFGTFVRESKTVRMKESPEPVTILLPCPDYMMVTPPAIAGIHREMTLTASLVANRHGTYAVTLPVSDSNDPARINWNQLRHLHSGSLVCMNGSWFQAVFPLLAERGCRVGIISSDLKNFPRCFKEHDTDGMIVNNRRLWYFPALAATWLYGLGARKILYFGSDTAVASMVSRGAFEKALRGAGLPAEGLFRVFPSSLTLRERLRLLGGTFREKRPDALVIELNPYPLNEPEPDFYEATGIPRSVKIVTPRSRLLRQPEFAGNAYVITGNDTCGRLAEFLLSNRHGQFFTEVEEEFISGAEYAAKKFNLIF